MIPSPMPISTWTPIIAPATEPTDTASLPPRAYSIVNAMAAITGAVNAASPAASVTRRRRAPEQPPADDEHARSRRTPR